MYTWVEQIRTKYGKITKTQAATYQHQYKMRVFKYIRYGLHDTKVALRYA